MAALATILLAFSFPFALSLILEDGIGRLSALGFNSRSVYGCNNLSEANLFEASNALVTTGLKDAGYEYVNIGDDCWQVKSGRDSVTHQILPNLEKFPNGIKGTASKIHNLGLKFGIYSAASKTSCPGYPGSLGHEATDASTWAAWGVDALTYGGGCYLSSKIIDTCKACLPDFLPATETRNGTCIDLPDVCPVGYNFSTSRTHKRFEAMSNALAAQNRTILYAIDNPSADIWEWGNATANSWRTTLKSAPSWARITSIINRISFLSHYAGFTGHNDAGLLQVGNGGLTEHETRSHFALWAMMKSPLLISTDIARLSETNLEILRNKYLLAFNQDPVYGSPAMPYKWGVNPDWTFNSTHPAEYWSGTYSNGTLVAMVNTLDKTQTMRAAFDEIPGFFIGLRYSAYNAWTGKTLGCYENYVEMDVESHGTAVILFTKDCAGA